VSDYNFAKRVLSAAIAGPIAIGAVILGFPYVDILASLFLLILLWEWSKMSKLPLFHPINGVASILLASVIIGSSAFLPMACLALVGLSYTAFYHYQVGAKILPSLILLSGPLYMALGMMACLYLAKMTPLTLLWALLVVWATDIGAYVIGSIVGGPRLAPRISPGKTWSGLMGGSMVGSALGITIAPHCQIPLQDGVFLLGLTIGVTLIGHAGDLLESAAKRLFKVKDSSRLFPGHGGLLDRIDSLLLVAPFLALLKFFKVF
jgi:phosphatidate cytidylyltransferase